MRTQNPQLSEIFKTPQRKTYTTVAVTMLLIGVMIFFGLRPALKKIRALNKEIKDKQEFLDRIDGKLVALNYLIKRKDEVKDKFPAFNEDFPYEKKSGFLVANFDAIASEFGLVLSKVEFNDQIEEEDLSLDDENLDIEDVFAIEGTVTVLGEFDQIDRFVDYLEDFPRIFDVKNFALVPVEERTRFSDGEPAGLTTMRGEVVMYIYHWGERV